MRSLHCLPATLLLLVTTAWAPMPVHAAESYDNCTGFIGSLPTTVSTQGVWCLNKNLSTAITSGAAITIAANNVTIDCNDFKIGGLAAGNNSQTYGIRSNSRQNATVRNCAVRGFYLGIGLFSGAGHLVEDNRLDNNLRFGIAVSGDNNRVQRNAVYDTGGFSGNPRGIEADADVIDNTVAGVFGTAANVFPYGIYIRGNGNEAGRNRIRGLVTAGTGNAVGIFVSGDGITMSDNQISAAVATGGYGIYGYGDNTVCAGNTVVNLGSPYYACEAAADNLSLP